MGMLVAIPTAIPELPLISRFGTFAGRTVGSSKRPSKLGVKTTVSLSMSSRSSIARAVRRASVYRYAAAESPSTDPKFPWPSTRG